MEKINVKKIRGKFRVFGNEGTSGNNEIFESWADDTTSSLKILANKINEIIDVLNKKDQFDLKNAERISNLLEFMYKSKEEDSNPICKKCVYQRVVTCDKCSDELIAGEDIDGGKAVFKSKTDGKIYMVKEDSEVSIPQDCTNSFCNCIHDWKKEVHIDWEKEFDKSFKDDCVTREDIKQFIRNLLK